MKDELRECLPEYHGKRFRLGHDFYGVKKLEEGRLCIAEITIRTDSSWKGFFFKKVFHVVEGQEAMGVGIIHEVAGVGATTSLWHWAHLALSLGSKRFPVGMLYQIRVEAANRLPLLTTSYGLADA